jgi:hypothetical protein
MGIGGGVDAAQTQRRTRWKFTRPNHCIGERGPTRNFPACRSGAGAWVGLTLSRTIEPVADRGCRLGGARFPHRRGRSRLDCNTQSAEPLVAKPNYRFQKQQRELKKTRQKEEKLRKKQNRSDPTRTAATPQEERK